MSIDGAPFEANIEAGWMERVDDAPDGSAQYRLTPEGAKRAELLLDPRTRAVATALRQEYDSEHDAGAMDWTDFREQAIRLLMAADRSDHLRASKL